MRVVALASFKPSARHLLALGATRFPRTPGPDEDFIVLEDPEGNLFCVIDKS